MKPRPSNAAKRGFVVFEWFFHEYSPRKWINHIFLTIYKGFLTGNLKVFQTK
jgi:hypothetical protein